MAAPPSLSTLLEELVAHIATFLPSAASLVGFESVSTRHAALDTEDAWRRLCVERWEDKPRYRLTVSRQQFLDAHMKTTWKRRYAHFELDAKRTSMTTDELRSLGWYFNYTPDAGGLGRSTLRRVRFTDRLEVPDYPPLPYELDGPAGLVGQQVVATGLRSRPELNGRTGEALALEAESGRYAVAFEGVEKPLKLFSLNVRPTSDAPAAAGSTAGGAWARFGSVAATLPGPQQTLSIANFPRHDLTRLPDWEWLISNQNVTFVSCDAQGSLSYGGRGFSAEREEVLHASITEAEVQQAAQQAAQHAALAEAGSAGATSD